MSLNPQASPWDSKSFSVCPFVRTASMKKQVTCHCLKKSVTSRSCQNAGSRQPARPQENIWEYRTAESEAV